MNEVEETLRVLNNQVKEYRIQYDSFSIAYDEFSSKCEHTLEKETFDFISDVLYKAIYFYKNKLDESIQARQEIMTKYNINQEGTTNG